MKEAAPCRPNRAADAATARSVRRASPARPPSTAQEKPKGERGGGPGTALDPFTDTLRNRFQGSAPRPSVQIPATARSSMSTGRNRPGRSTGWIGSASELNTFHDTLRSSGVTTSTTSARLRIDAREIPSDGPPGENVELKPAAGEEFYILPGNRGKCRTVGAWRTFNSAFCPETGGNVERKISDDVQFYILPGLGMLVRCHGIQAS